MKFKNFFIKNNNKLMNEIIENLLFQNINEYKFDDLQNEKIANDFTESLFSAFIQKKNKIIFTIQ